MFELLHHERQTGDQSRSRLGDEGHGAVWLTDEVYVDDRGGTWAWALGATTGRAV